MKLFANFYSISSRKEMEKCLLKTFLYIYRSSNIRNQIRVTMILTRKLFAPD